MRLRDKIERSNLISSPTACIIKLPGERKKYFLLRCSGANGVSTTPEVSQSGGIQVVNIRLEPPKRYQYMNVEGFAPFNPPAKGKQTK